LEFSVRMLSTDAHLSYVLSVFRSKPLPRSLVFAGKNFHPVGCHSLSLVGLLVLPINRFILLVGHAENITLDLSRN